MRRTFLILFPFVFLLATCTREDWSIPSTPCSLDFADSSQVNLKGSAYQGIIDRYVRRGVPGVVLLVRTPEDGLWIGAAGKSNIEKSEAMLPCHIHHSASVAKMYMGTAIMLLVEDGKIDLDAHINQYLDKEMCNHIANGNSATVRQLLNHTSGIRDFVEEPKFLTDYFNDFFNDYTTIDFLRYVYDKPANFLPGTKVVYCNTAFVLLTLIIDRVTGRPHADFITERIFRKVGLNQTYYKNETGYPQPTGMVNSYLDRYGNGELENITEVAVHFDDTNVGHDAMLASVHDYARFMEALMRGQIVSQESLTQMKVWHYDESNEIFYGLALLREETAYGDALGHGGANLGVAMQVLYYPERDATIVFCSNIAGFFISPARDPLLRLVDEVEKIAFK